MNTSPRRLLPLLVLLTLPAALQAQFYFTTNNGAITITGYTGPGGAVTIPSTMNGLPVTSIGSVAFAYCTRMTSVTIPNSITNIEDGAFKFCGGLTSVQIPKSVTHMGNLAFGGCTHLTGVALGDSVTSIGNWAFFNCTSLSGVTVPGSVTSIGSCAFQYCTSLTEVFFQGNCPSIDSDVFDGDVNATLYYLPGTVGWNPEFQGGRPILLWNPEVRTSSGSLGIRTNGFGFTITGTTGLVIVVEACTNLANPLWSPLQTLTLTNGSSCFSDPQWTNSPARLYRLRSGGGSQSGGQPWRDRTSWLTKPPMGFNLWRVGASEATALTAATNALTTGKFAAGFQYINFDAGWCLISRDANGDLQTSATLFPHGMAWLAQQIHSMGGKLGLYLDCTSVPGDPNGRGQAGTPLASAAADASLIASWGIDYVKIDGGNMSSNAFFTWMQTFTTALDNTAATNSNDSPIVVESAVDSCADAYFYPLSPWMPKRINVMRICGDAGAWGTEHASAWDYLLYPAANSQWLSGPGHYVYMNGQPNLNWRSWMTVDDLEAWFGISVIMSQPLISGDPISITPTEMQLIYTNSDFLSIAQDLAGFEGWPVSANGNAQTWVRPLANGDWAVGLWNRATDSTASVSCLLSNLTGVLTNVVYVRDVYNHTNFFATSSITATVNANGLNLYRVLLPSAGDLEGEYNNSQGSASRMLSPHDPSH